MTAIFTSADFDKAINLSLNGLVVEGQPEGLTSAQRVSIIQHLRDQGVETQLRQWMIDNPARLPDGMGFARRRFGVFAAAMGLGQRPL